MSYGNACNGCGGEDCSACEVYLETQFDRTDEEFYEDEFEQSFDDSLDDCEADMDDCEEPYDDAFADAMECDYIDDYCDLDMYPEFDG